MSSARRRAARDGAYLTQAELADALGVSTRWVQKLEERGLPAEGFRGTCRYPVPDAIVWYLEWRAAIAEAELRHEPPPNALSATLAMARYRRRTAKDLADLEFQLATDPGFRATFDRTACELWGSMPNGPRRRAGGRRGSAAADA